MLIRLWKPNIRGKKWKLRLQPDKNVNILDSVVLVVHVAKDMVQGEQWTVVIQTMKRNFEELKPQIILNK